MPQSQQFGGIGFSADYGMMNPYGYPRPTAEYRPLPVRREVDRVHGKEGADAFFLAPNSSAIFLDETQPVVWLKTTDSAGYATVTGYSISPLQTSDAAVLEVEEPQSVDTFKEDVMTRLDKLERMIEEYAKQPYARPTREQQFEDTKRANGTGPKPDQKHDRNN